MADIDSVTVRPFRRDDVPQLHALMEGLAEFEGYIDRFRVTEEDIVEFGLGERPTFSSYVAVDSAEPHVLLGMAVIYTVAWTYDMKPTVVLKELYVRPESRGLGVGCSLMAEVRRQGESIGASKVCWTVLQGNKAAEKFYQGLGGEPDSIWNNWVMPLRLT